MTPSSNGSNLGTLRPVNRPDTGREKKTLVTPVNIASASVALSVLTIEFEQPVVLRSTPQYTTDVAGAVPVSAAMTSPTTLALTFDNPVAAATVINIPFMDDAVRNQTGGYVNAGTFTI